MGRGSGIATAVALILAGAGAARGDEEALKRDLEETRGQVDTLRKRVEALEKEGAGGGEAPAGLTVAAPKSRRIDLSGQVLVWGERWDGTYRPADPGGDAIQDQAWLRVSLQADVSVEEDLDARVEIRDARLWGSEPSTVQQTNTPGTGTDLKQGWFEARDLLGSGTSARAGRQVLSYGDQRLVGENDWSTYGRSFDAVLLSRTFERTRTKADLLLSRVAERGNGPVTPGVDDDDRDLFGVYTVTPKALHHSDLDAYALLVRDLQEAAGEAPGDSGNTGFVTAGARVAGAKGGLDWGAEGAVQRGRVAGDRLSAWAGHARAGWTCLDAKWKPRFGIEWDRATGDDDPADGDRGSFQTLFPTNHMHYGILDLLAWQNMQAFRAGVRFRPHEKLTVEVDAWRLELAEPEDAWTAASGAVIRPGAAGTSRLLGHELDAVLTWKSSEHLTVSVGGSYFRDGGFVRDTGSGGDTFWVYARFLVAF
jgi:hypothetical protein